MFYYLRGEVALIDLNLLVLDCGGVGFSVNTTTNTLSKVKIGEQAKLFTYCSIKEDAFDIFGFASRAELEDALVHPEKHENLIVRIGGYAEYFNRLSPVLKQSVIDRTEY